MGVYCETYEKTGYNPKEERPVITTRRRVQVDADLPMKEEYRALLERIVGSAGAPEESPGG